MYSEKNPPRSETRPVRSPESACEAKACVERAPSEIATLLARLDQAISGTANLSFDVAKRYELVLRPLPKDDACGKGEPLPNTQLSQYLVKLIDVLESSNDRLRDVIDRCELPFP